jgi:hypothetical protein
MCSSVQSFVCKPDACYLRWVALRLEAEVCGKTALFVLLSLLAGSSSLLGLELG